MPLSSIAAAVIIVPDDEQLIAVVLRFEPPSHALLELVVDFAGEQVMPSNSLQSPRVCVP